MRLSTVFAATTLLAATIVARADVVLAPDTPIVLTASSSKPTFGTDFTFSIANQSTLSGTLNLLKTANLRTALQSLSASLSQETAPGSWTTVWSDSAQFTKTQAKGSWFFNFDDLPVSSGKYRLTLDGSVYPNVNYSGTYLYQLSIAAVPEPETYALMGLGMAALLLRRRRKGLTF